MTMWTCPACGTPCFVADVPTHVDTCRYLADAGGLREDDVERLLTVAENQWRTATEGLLQAAVLAIRRRVLDVYPDASTVVLVGSPGEHTYRETDVKIGRVDDEVSTIADHEDLDTERLEQLEEECNDALAWLGELAPDDWQGDTEIDLTGEE